MAQIRLQKLLSERGVASRRKAEELILQGKVKVNGHPAKLGDKADDRRDVVTVCGKRLEPAEIPRYILLNKPRGYITTMSDERGRRCVAELVQDVGARVFPVGRLDKDSEGLLLMTSDGDFANAMMHPAAHVPKYYRVTLHSKVQPEQIERFCKGIELDGRMTAPARLEVLLEEPERTVIQVVLYEGRNRQIRRMCRALDFHVKHLKRVRIMNITLGGLERGQYRELTEAEVAEIRRLVKDSTNLPMQAATDGKPASVTRRPADPARRPAAGQERRDRNG